eukprot:TRINITY_DN29580_c0_g1_i1.p1 TRINITY_DN29580_c0_g1~~TRINITY_DN29580_c0_g1_i1.p1  ORF type:complete len:659 (-),score=121.71 TRINITY_DN29580_c0_g1_i1:431-2407(-)
MRVGHGSAALVTGAGSGIGRALALHLGMLGSNVSIVDFSDEGGLETLRLFNDAVLVREGSPGGGPPPTAIFVKCDVSKPEELHHAFSEHMRTFGRLDVCVNNAGIGEKVWFAEDDSANGTGHWRKVVDINLLAVIDGTRLAVLAMQANKKQRGAIINVASAAGLYPSPGGPVYSASKGGVVLFTRSLAGLARSKGVRINALCPEYIETPLLKQISGAAAKRLPKILESMGGLIPMEKIVEGVMELIEDESRAGDCLWITNRHGKQYWPSEEEKQRYLVAEESSKRPASQKNATKERQAGEGPGGLPTVLRKMVVHTLSTDFRSATKIVTIPLKPPMPPRGSVLIKYLYVGVNASDVNFSAGRYFGSAEAASRQLPFDAGFEGVGVVVAVGEAVKGLRPGRSVATLSYGAFSDFAVIDAKLVIPVEAATPQMVALLTSGLTASIALEKAGRMGSGETVLVTAAAGGTGQFAVQLAKLAGNRVVATCGGAEKASLLKGLGVDRVIDYKTENVAEVLKREFRDGVDIVYESVGGDMFRMCMNALAKFGRCIVIGMMSQYTAGDAKDWAPAQYPGLAEKLLWKSQTLAGFFLVHYASDWKRHLAKLYSLHKAGLLQVAIDGTDFTGLEAVTDAVEHLHSGRSFGKVVVRIAPDAPPVRPSRL